MSSGIFYIYYAGASGGVGRTGGRGRHANAEAGTLRHRGSDRHAPTSESRPADPHRDRTEARTSQAMVFGMRTFTVTRSIDTSAASEEVRALIDDYREWSRWSPWESRDGWVQREFEGPEFGEGAYYKWTARGVAMSGNSMILLSAPELVELRLVFTRPRRVNLPSRFTVRAVDDTTRVTWAVTSETRGVWGSLAAFRLRSWLGRDLERGLATLANVAETSRSTVARTRG